MYLLPYRKFVLKTSLSRKEAVEYINKAVFTHPPNILYVRGANDFYAKISNERFTAHRLLDYRGNAVLPILHGHFVETHSGTEIHIQMYPPVINLLIASAFLIFPLYALAQGLFKYLIYGQAFPEVFKILAIPAFVYIVVMAFFTPEAKLAESFVKEIYTDEKNPDSSSK